MMFTLLILTLTQTQEHRRRKTELILKQAVGNNSKGKTQVPKENLEKYRNKSLKTHGEGSNSAWIGEVERAEENETAELDHRRDKGSTLEARHKEHYFTRQNRKWENADMDLLQET